MPTPNSGTTDLTSLDFSTNLGDLSKLEAIPSDKSSDESDESDQPVQQEREDSGTETVPGAGDEGAEEAEVEVEQAAPAQNVDGTITPTKGARDYSDIPEQDRWIFKNMHRKAYDALKPVWLEKKTWETKLKEKEDHLEKLKDYQFYHHENGYKLSPEYNKMEQDFQRHSIMADHYKRGLAALARGESFRDVAIVDGKLQYADNIIEPNEENKEQVRLAISNFAGEAQRVQRDLTGFSEKFTNKYKEFDGQFRAIDEQAFSELRKNDAFKKLEEQEIQRFPPEVRHMTVYKSMASLLALNQGLVARLKALESKQPLKAAAGKTRKSQGPGEGRQSGGATTGLDQNGADFLKQFNQRMGRE